LGKEKGIQSIIGEEAKRKKGTRRKKTEKIEERGHVEVYK